MRISMKKRKIGYVHNSVSGDFSFSKDKQVQHESKLEKDFLTMISYDDSVVDIIEQPFTILYQLDDKEYVYEYTPDFLVHFKVNENGLQPKPLLVEVKPKNILAKRFCEFKPKFKAAISYCSQENMQFKIYDERRIHGIYFKNIKLLKRYARLAYDIDEKELIINYVDTAGHASIDNILQFLNNTGQQWKMSLGHIYQLLNNKVLSTDLTEEINLNTVVLLHNER